MRGACCVSSTLTCLRGLHVQWFFAFDLLRQKFVHTKLSQSKNRQTSNLHATKSCQAQFPGDRVGWSEKRSETGWRNTRIKPALHSHPRCYMGNFQPGWPARQVLHPHTDTVNSTSVYIPPWQAHPHHHPPNPCLKKHSTHTHTQDKVLLSEPTKGGVDTQSRGLEDEWMWTWHGLLISFGSPPSRFPSWSVHPIQVVSLVEGLCLLFLFMVFSEDSADVCGYVDGKRTIRSLHPRRVKSWSRTRNK